MVINVDGAVTPCCYWQSYGNGGENLGNIESQSLREIWNGPAFQRLRQDNLDNRPDHPCQSCLAKKVFETATLTTHPHDAGAPRPGTPAFGNSAQNFREFQAGRTLLRSRPLMMSVSSTAVCNIKCTFCNQVPQRVAGLALSDRVLGQVIATTPYLMSLAWLGGETLLDRRFRTFVDSAEADACADMTLGLGTNGLLVTAGVVEKLLLKFRHVSVVFSIDSFNKETYERLRYGASYDKVLGNLKDLQAMAAAGGRVTVSVAAGLMKSTVPELTENLKAMAALGVTSPTLSPFTAWPPHEMVNCFNAFEDETRGWGDSFEQAGRFIASRPGGTGETALASAGCAIAVVRDMVAALRHRYRDSYPLTVIVSALPRERMETTWPVPAWDTFKQGLFGSYVWIDADCANLVNLEYCLLQDGEPLPGYRSAGELMPNPGNAAPETAAPETAGGAWFFPGPTDPGDGRRFIGVLMAPKGGEDPRSGAHGYRVGLRPKALLKGLKQPKRPVVVVFDPGSDQRPIGYLRVERPGRFTIEIPGDIPPAALNCAVIEDELSYYAGGTDPATVSRDAGGRPVISIAWR